MRAGQGTRQVQHAGTSYYLGSRRRCFLRLTAGGQC